MTQTERRKASRIFYRAVVAAYCLWVCFALPSSGSAQSNPGPVNSHSRAQPGRPPTGPTSATPATKSGLADREHRARELIKRGEELFATANYDGALAQFTQAYELLEGHSRQAIVLHNLAVCHERMFRYDLAIRYYRRYLHEARPAAGERQAIEAILHTLAQLLATVVIQSNVRASVWVDDREAGTAPGTLKLPAGRHLLQLRAPLREPEQTELILSSGETRKLSFSLHQLSDYAGLSPLYGHIGSVVTGTLLTTTVILGAVNLAKYRAGRREIDAQGSNLATPPLTATDDELKRWSTVADLALYATVVTGLATLVLYLLVD